MSNITIDLKYHGGEDLGSIVRLDCCPSQWFTAFLRLRPFTTAPHVATPNYKVMFVAISEL